MERASRAPELLPFLRQEPEYLWKENPLPKLLKVKPPMNTEQPSRNQNLTAETRRVAPWERAVLACPGCLTPCMQDACPAPPKIPPVSRDVGNNTRPNLNPCPRVEKRKTFIQRG